MTRKMTGNNHGAAWTTKEIAAIRRLVKAGASGKAIAMELGRSVVAVYQKASVEGISLSAQPKGRRSAVAKKAKAASSKMRRTG